VLGREEIGEADAAATLHILLKYQSDIEKATKELLGRPGSLAYVLGAFIAELRGGRPAGLDDRARGRVARHGLD
jgi:hypothetical protein